jgi:hypothetical protein
LLVPRRKVVMTEKMVEKAESEESGLM